MGTQDDEKKEKHRKPYEKPTATKLTPEQAKLKLLGHASMGDEGAKDLLKALFPEIRSENSRSEESKDQPKDSQAKKKSA